jgi:glyoxylase-like metal-dependent hydrolase (beta-lactamase superfamily II)
MTGASTSGAGSLQHEWVVTHVPGHTDGSCVLEFREHGVVFVGDAFCTVSPVTAPTSDQQKQQGEISGLDQPFPFR